MTKRQRQRLTQGFAIIAIIAMLLSAIGGSLAYLI